MYIVSYAQYTVEHTLNISDETVPILTLIYQPSKLEDDDAYYLEIKSAVVVHVFKKDN